MQTLRTTILGRRWAITFPAGLRERYGKMHAEEQRARGLEEVATAFVGNHARLPAARLMAARMRG